MDQTRREDPSEDSSKISDHNGQENKMKEENALPGDPLLVKTSPTSHETKPNDSNTISMKQPEPEKANKEHVVEEQVSNVSSEETCSLEIVNQLNENPNGTIEERGTNNSLVKEVDEINKTAQAGSEQIQNSTEQPSTEKPGSQSENERGTSQQEQNAQTEKSTEEQAENNDEVDYVIALTKRIMEITNNMEVSSAEVGLSQRVEELKVLLLKVFALFTDKTNLCVGLEKQNTALTNQIFSLKSVVSITKELLGLRNMEVEHLQRNLNVFEESINAERERHKVLCEKLKLAMELNEKLKNEYQVQQQLFQTIRSKYHEKIEILKSEKKRLEDIVNGGCLVNNEEDSQSLINGSSVELKVSDENLSNEKNNPV